MDLKVVDGGESFRPLGDELSLGPAGDAAHHLAAE